MGGVPVLLMIAAMGMTYGPQPDDRGGAEYLTAAGRTRSDHTLVMKPDTNDAASSPGFSFPVHATTGGSADNTGFGVDRAGRDLGARSATDTAGGSTFPQLPPNPLDSIRVPPPATRNPIVPPATRNPIVAPATRSPMVTSQPQAPQFTGSDPTGEYARTRVGGPSTDPTNTRDNLWGNLSGVRGAAPSTASKNANAFGANQRFDSRTTNAQGYPISSRTSANGLVPSDTFGRTPGGLTLPAAPNSRTSPGTLTQGGYSRFQQTQPDRQTATVNPASRTQYDAIADGQRRAAGAFGQGSASGNSLATAAITRDLRPAQTRAIPDPPAVSAQTATGAWSVDIYGRPLDREGNLLQTNDPNTAAITYNTAETQSEPSARRSYSPLNQPSARLPVSARSPAGSSQALPASANTGFVRETNHPSNRGELARLDASKTQTQLVQPQQLAAQPLFNGLLLISFVANVYLVFWLKNLRLQFHDLVTAKRIANSNAASSSSAA